MIDTEIQMILQRSSSWSINCYTVLIKEAFGKATQCENHVQLVFILMHDRLMLMLMGESASGVMLIVLRK